MSFMFKPIDFDDTSAVNKIEIDLGIDHEIVNGNVNIGRKLGDLIDAILKTKGKANILIDGYVSANFRQACNLLHQHADADACFEFIDTAGLFKESTVLDDALRSYLPEKSPEDPVQLFGRLFEKEFLDLFDLKKVDETRKILKHNQDRVVILCGNGSASASFVELGDAIVYVDVTPKTTALRALRGEFANFGDAIAKPFNLLMRRNYYIDFELSVRTRKDLLQKDRIDLYISADDDKNWQLLSKTALNSILSELTKRPYRCKPVYLNGIWGGEFIKKVRNLPIKSNVAWIFELIPMEVSIVAEYRSHTIEFPYATFFQKFPDAVMGTKSTRVFGDYFPVRCNYDDTYHSNGNMSIQVHPPKDFCNQEYGEKWGQDEAYYVIATGHDAKTYMGFKDSTDIDDFFAKTSKSEQDGSEVRYQEYVNGIASQPGQQFMIPGGTIHASGQNQFILELGSLTIGSYTYKMYDYNRRDPEGNRRPIHTINAEKVINRKLPEAKIKESLVIEPIYVDSGPGWKEEVVARTEAMYYESRRIEIAAGHEVVVCKEDAFALLCMVDGEQALIQDFDHPERTYQQNFLDIVVVPASIEKYRIVNDGCQPVRIHLTQLKKDD